MTQRQKWKQLLPRGVFTQQAEAEANNGEDVHFSRCDVWMGVIRFQTERSYKLGRLYGVMYLYVVVVIIIVIILGDPILCWGTPPPHIT